jgi:carboxylesterase
MADTLIVPKSEPFFYPGSRTGCLLLHGFSSMPEEMQPLGQYLHEQGFTVLGARLSGHATHPWDLFRTEWRDWVITVEESLALLHGCCDRIFIIGKSMGGILALLAAARFSLSGTVVISTTYDLDDDWRLRTVRFWSFFIPLIFKGRTPILDFKVARRERDYPAYPFFPTRILAEVEDLKHAMYKEIDKVRCPVLIVHSRKDSSVPAKNVENLFAALQAPDKELFWCEEIVNSIVLDTNCQPAYEKISSFLKRVENSE